ncbi:hypothetical protein TNCV_1389291 [Trichonephila clavipes]|nr:hypothetical protein TNCV_1389291 [Trichonephila clavipes]
MVPGLKVSRSYGLLLRNYPSECNKLLVHGLGNPPRFFVSIPIGRIIHIQSLGNDKNHIHIASRARVKIRIYRDSTDVSGAPHPQSPPAYQPPDPKGWVVAEDDSYVLQRRRDLPNIRTE